MNGYLQTACNDVHFFIIVSIPWISTMIFAIAGGSIAEFMGRKPTLILGQLCMLLGWMMVYFANHFPLALAGRFVTGIGIGITLPVQTLHLSEIALIKMRGVLSMMNYLIMNFSNIYILMVGDNCSLDLVIAMSACPSLIFFVGALFLPESPMWLVKKGHLPQAKQALLRLRGSSYDYSYEIEELEALVKSKDDTNWMEKLKELKSRRNMVPFLITTSFLMLQVSHNCPPHLLENKFPNNWEIILFLNSLEKYIF